MKSSILFNQTVLAILLLQFILVSCGEKKVEYNIGVSQCSQDEWREKQNNEISIEASIYNNINLEILSVNDDNEKQIRDIEYFISAGKDLIVVSPNQSEAITPVVEKAFDMGIPVIVIDRKIDSDKYTAFISADNREIGRSMGDYVRMLASDRKQRLFEVSGLKGSTSAAERHAGLHEVIDSLPNLHFIGDISANWKSEDAYALMDSVFSTRQDIDLVVAHNDRMAYGAYQAAKFHNLEDKITFTGVDALTGKGLGVDMVMDNILDATFIYPTAGERIIQVAMDILSGNSFEREILLSSDLVDYRNARSIMLLGQANKEAKEKLERLSTSLDKYLQQYNLQKMLNLSLIIIAVLLVMTSFVVVRLYLQGKKNSILIESSTKAKLDFFAGISHDLRTPLTLMTEPLDTLKGSDHLDLQERKLLGSLNRNLTILLRLVNQTLDFRKFEEGKMNLNLSCFDLRQSVTNWIEPFVHVAKRKHIDLRLNISESMTSEIDFNIIADEEKCERIIYNLLSNAVRFTPDRGHILLLVEPFEKENRRWFRIIVSDDGIGIPKDKRDKVFQSFYQGNPNYMGSGIGLALVKAFSEMHGGSVSVSSEDNKGSSFKVEIPAGQPGHVIDNGVIVDGESAIFKGALYTAEQGDGTSWVSTDRIENVPSVLVCDDNADLRAMLGRILSPYYSVFEASDGKSALEQARRIIPDIIISDVMMPVMDGIEFCNKAKEDLSICHIPFVMLTSNSSEEQQLKGFQNGADAYVVKPFRKELLLTVLSASLENRKRIRVHYEQFITPGSVTHPVSTDDSFVDKFVKIVEANISDENLSVDYMSDQLCLSRTQVYRKIKALTGYSPVELIRVIRLKRASVLLNTTDKSISDISYTLGFGSPSYFTRCYREYYGETPQNARERV